MTASRKTSRRPRHLWPGLAVAVALAQPAPALAQTFEEAVRANLALGLQLCLRGSQDVFAWVNQFRAAGFAEQVVRSSTNSDTTHTFTAPADTVRVELYYGEMPEHCIVSTRHMGVTGAGQVLDAVVPRLYPGYVRKVALGPVNPATKQPARCVRYEDPTNPIGHVIGVAPAGAPSGCLENGTSQFYSSSRV